MEVRAAGSQSVLRTKTDAEGNFRILAATEGEYKFKVTKDGFKALSGKILVNRTSPPRLLAFILTLGT